MSINKLLKSAYIGVLAGPWLVGSAGLAAPPLSHNA